MHAPFSPDTRHLAGILLLTVVAIAHAGVLVILSLVTLPYADTTNLSGFWEVVARNGIWAAAILMPAGFFLSVIGRDVQKTNRFIWLVYIGAVCLAAGVITLGIGLL